MFKRIAAAALMLGSLMAVAPVGAYAREWRDYRAPVVHREYRERVREVRAREWRDRGRFERRAWEREHFHRGFYGRYGHWHR
jgi:hypothetical protein